MCDYEAACGCFGLSWAKAPRSSVSRKYGADIGDVIVSEQPYLQSIKVHIQTKLM